MMSEAREKLHATINAAIGNCNCEICKAKWPELHFQCRKSGACLSLALHYIEQAFAKEEVN